MMFVGAGPPDRRLRWYEWDGAQWTGHDAMEEDIIHGHSLAVLDVNGDGHAGIFSAQMGPWSREPIVNPSPAMRILHGDGTGRFRATVVSDPFGNHESRPADLDGDMDILAKPYNWRTPRVDIWLWVGE